MADKHRPSDATVKRTVLCPREAHFVCISSWFSCVTFICGLGSLVIPFLHPSTIEAAPAPILVAEPSLRLRVGSETRDLGGASLSVIQTRTSMQNTAHAEARGLDQVTWSGEYSGWRDYVRRVQLAYERTERKKRKLLGAELASRLRGKAWEVAVEVDHGQLCKKSGPRYLLRFLEERLLKSPINDLGIRLEDMFVKLRRSPGTPMAQWASQVREQYRMLRRSLGKLRAKNLALTRDNVRQLDDAPSRRGAVEGNARRRSVEEPEPLRGESASLRHSATTLSPGDSPAGAAADGPRASPDGDPPEDEQRAGRDSRPDAHDADPGEHPQHHRLDDWDWDRRSWGHQSRWSHRDWQRWKAGKWSAQDGDDSSDESIIEWEEFLHDEDILPEEILGWILLRKAGLSPSARLAVQSAVQGDLSFDRVERTLRDQEEELLGLERKGSGKGKQAPRRSFWVEDEGHWGLVTCSLEDEFSEDQIAWWHEPGEVPEPDDETASCWTSSPAGHDVEWTMWNDEWMTQDSDGVWWTFADVKPWMDIEEVMLADPSLGQEMAEIYGQFEAKRRTFQESRKIMKDKLLGRGFFPSGGRKGGPRKGKGGRFSGSAAGKGGFSPVRSQASSVFGAKGFQKGGLKPGAVGQKGYSGCFICGQRDHDYRSCPKRSQGGTAALTEAVHAAFMVLEMDVQEAPPPDEGEVLHAATSAPENHNCVYATTSYSFQGKAVIDTGATETIGSIHAIHQLMELKGQNGETAKVKVYPQHTRRFKFGDGKVADALSYIEVPQTLNGKTVYLGMYVFDSQDVPILISIKTLRKLGALLDVARSMVVFQGVDAQLAIQLEVSPSGHLLLDLTKDWLTSSVNLAAETDTPQSAQYMPHVCVHSRPASARVRQQTCRPFDPPSEPWKESDLSVPMAAPSTPSTAASEQIPKVPAKGKNKEKKEKVDPRLKYDYSRTQLADGRDPRAQGPPCMGAHKAMPMGRGSLSGRNASAEWIVCETCRIRLSYTPSFGATGHCRQAGPLPQDVMTTMTALGEDVKKPEMRGYLNSKDVALAGAEASLQRRLKTIQAERGARAKAVGRPVISIDKKQDEVRDKKEDSPDSVTSWSDVQVPPAGAPSMAETPGKKAARRNEKSAEDQEFAENLQK
ncbi:TY1B-A [Symbiodinium natans]|uniref:TY1B-A protein n=1 Tax=Symbiodinium natans TaxID=878477 RepID=A0A812QAU5_9DINO|nr:TY1B-A [Symbiodinium natans]